MNAHDNSFVATGAPITMGQVLAAMQKLGVSANSIIKRGVVSNTNFYSHKDNANYVMRQQDAARAFIAEASAAPDAPAQPSAQTTTAKPVKTPKKPKKAKKARPSTDASPEPIVEDIAEDTVDAETAEPIVEETGAAAEPATDHEPDEADDADGDDDDDDVVLGGGAAPQVIADAKRDISKLNASDVDGADAIIRRLIDAGASTAQGINITNAIAEKLKGTATKSQVGALWREAAKAAALQLRMMAPPAGDEARGNPTEHLFDLTESAGYEAWRDGRTGRGCVSTGPGHHLVLGSQASDDAMRRLYHSDPLPGRRVPTSDSVAAVSALYSAQVAEDNAERRTSLRYGGVFNEQHTLVGVVIDNGDARRTATYVTAAGVTQIEGEAIDQLGVYFVRSSDILPFPETIFDGNYILAVKKLRELVATRSFDDALALFGVLVSEMLPGAHTLPALAIDGLPGSGKTSAARFIKYLLDPASDDAAGAPKSIEDFYVAAGDARVMVVDNLNRLGTDLSDAICRVASGGTVPKRALFSDATKHLAHVHAMIILTTIELWLASRPDIIERLVKLRLTRPAKRRSDAETARIAKQNAPYIIGALRAALQLVLANIDWKGDKAGDRLTTTRLVLTALDKALGKQYPEHKFLEAYDNMRRDGATASAMSNPLLLAVAGVALQSAPDSNGAYTLNVQTSALHDRIRIYKPNEKCFWPETSAALGRALATSTHMMALAGMAFDHKHTNSGTRCKVTVSADAAARLRAAASQQGTLFKDANGKADDAGDIDEVKRLCGDVYAVQDAAAGAPTREFIDAAINSYRQANGLKTLRQSTPKNLKDLRQLLANVEQLSGAAAGDAE